MTFCDVLVVVCDPWFDYLCIYLKSIHELWRLMSTICEIFMRYFYNGFLILINPKKFCFRRIIRKLLFLVLLQVHLNVANYHIISLIAFVLTRLVFGRGKTCNFVSKLSSRISISGIHEEGKLGVVLYCDVTEAELQQQKNISKRRSSWRSNVLNWKTNFHIFTPL